MDFWSETLSAEYRLNLEVWVAYGAEPGFRSRAESEFTEAGLHALFLQMVDREAFQIKTGLQAVPMAVLLHEGVPRFVAGGVPDVEADRERYRTLIDQSVTDRSSTFFVGRHVGLQPLIATDGEVVTTNQIEGR